MRALDSPESVRGVAAVSELMKRWLTAFDEFTMDIGEYIDTGHAVVCVTHSYGKGKASGLEIDLSATEVYEFRGDRIVRVTWDYADRDVALAAVAAPG